MKPPAKKPASVKGAKPRVMFANCSEMRERNFTVNQECDPSSDRMWTAPMACIPCRTVEKARACVKLHATEFQSLVDLGVSALVNMPGFQLPAHCSARDQATAVLKALGLDKEGT